MTTVQPDLAPVEPLTAWLDANVPELGAGTLRIDRIHNGTIEVARDEATNLYLFPDRPRTMAQFQQLRAGKLQKLRF